jgi:hypothetical protein
MANKETIKITLNVTQEDIQNGKQSCCENCALALAARREFPLSESVSVWSGPVSVLDVFYSDRVDTYRLGDEAEDFIGRFDFSRATVDPQDFEIELIDSDSL